MNWLNQAKALLTGPEATAVGLLLAVIGIVLAFVFYKRSLRNKEPRWDARGRIIIDDEDHPKDNASELQVLFRGEPVGVVSIDRFVLWNAGKETIRREDLVAMDQLRISAQDDGIILDARILATNKESCAFSIARTTDNKAAIVTFDYVDQNNGVVIQLITTTRKPLRPLGTIKGSSPLKRARIHTPSFIAAILPDRYLSKVPAFIRRKLDALLGLSVALAGAAVASLEVLKGEEGNAPLIYLAGIYVLCGIALIAIESRPVPKGLEMFNDEPLTGRR